MRTSQFLALSSFVLSCAAGAVAWALLSSAQSPKDELQYQIRLLDSGGLPVNQANLQVTFNVYNFASGGTSLYTEVDTLNVVDGLLTTRIGPLPSSLVNGPGDLYLGVTIAGDSEMSPRLPIGAVPFALKAKEPTLPAGAMLMTATPAAPSGFLLCDGSAVSRATYAELFIAIGTTYGAGDGVSTFNVPDLRQRFPLGMAAAGTGSTLGGSGGAIDHGHAAGTLSLTVPAHFHSAAATGADIAIGSSGSHLHSYDVTDIFFTPGGVFTEAVGAAAHTNNTNTATHTHAHSSFSGRVGLVSGGVDGDAPIATSAGTGSTAAANPPFLVVNYMIKT